MDERKYWLGFSLIPDIGPKRLLSLRNEFGDLKSAWHADEVQLLQAGLEPGPTTNLLERRHQLDLDHEMARIAKVKASFLTLADPAYPSLLREIENAPAVLYVRGDILPVDMQAICIVGTRKPTAYGRDVTYQLARELAQAGITIVSGLAQGVDTAAHRGALDGGGRTMGVSACGISEIYPRDSLELAREMVERGAVMTEFAIGTPPIGKNFPRRNRIMSGLSLGVLIVEAQERSGSLITAHLAAEQGRDVFAVPGNIYSTQSRGTNRLIQDGAKLVMTVEDVLAELNIAYDVNVTRQETERVSPANETEEQILRQLSVDPIHVDDLARRCDLPIAIVTSVLTLLELKGLARMVGNMQYTLTQSHVNE